MKIAVLGSGSWGGTLAKLWGAAGKEVSVWCHSQASYQRLLPSLGPDMSATVELNEAVEKAEIVVFAVGSQHVRQVAESLPKSWSPLILLSVAKGLELGSLKRMTEVLSEARPEDKSCVLSGPNLSSEIQQGMPAAAVIASLCEQSSGVVQKQLSVSTLRLYRSDDVIGVELGGTLKNVIAIAAGCSDGLKLGTNAKAALLTRGLAEMTRLAVAMGAQAQTLSGLSGMGDLFATCGSDLSRNYRLGKALAAGQDLSAALSALSGMAEGVTAAQTACELGQRLQLDLPIAQQVHAVLQAKSTPQQAIMALMSRPLVSE